MVIKLKITLFDYILLLVNNYIPPLSSEEEIEDYWNELEGTVEKLHWIYPASVIFVGGDLNARIGAFYAQLLSLVGDMDDLALPLPWFHRVSKDSKVNLAALVKSITEDHWRTPKSHSNHWFDAECQLAKKAIRVKLRRYRLTRTPEDLIKFFSLKKAFKDLIRKKKEAMATLDWESLANILETRDVKAFWRLVRPGHQSDTVVTISSAR
ncbi:UNVERIFIED_CONTAM: hypothetical protein K2H54_058279 [Gekko kuhli]